MKLSATRLEIVANKLKMNQQKLFRNYNSEIDELRRTWNPPDLRVRVNNRHLDHMQAIADFYLQTYLDAYLADDLTIDDGERAEIIGGLGALLNRKTYERDMNLPESHPLANDTERALSEIVTGAELTLRNIKSEKELEIKRTEEERMNQKVLREKEQKRYRIFSRIYEKSSGSITRPVSEDELIELEGIPKRELEDILYYLEGEGLIRNFAPGVVAIEHAGLKEMEDSMRNPERSTKHFESTIIQHFYGTVHSVQTGNQNTQNAIININPDLDEAISSLLDLINRAELQEIDKDDALEATERLRKLIQQEKRPDVVEAATKRLGVVKNVLEIAKLSVPAWPHLERLYHWFQSQAL
jgi:hypothetical protein